MKIIVTVEVEPLGITAADPMAIAVRVTRLAAEPLLSEIERINLAELGWTVTGVTLEGTNDRL